MRTGRRLACGSYVWECGPVAVGRTAGSEPRADGQNAVGGSPIALSYYNNILSTCFLAPMVLFAGEARGVANMLSGPEFSAFAWGAAITVSLPSGPCRAA